MQGGCKPKTTIVKTQFSAWFPAASNAAYTTVWMLLGVVLNCDPEGSPSTICREGAGSKLSVTVGSAHVVIAESELLSVKIVCESGQFSITGLSESVQNNYVHLFRKRTYDISLRCVLCHNVTLTLRKVTVPLLIRLARDLSHCSFSKTESCFAFVEAN